jgi:DNA polymerase-3 subunit beta
MKFTIERSALLRALNHAQSVVERRTTIPILNNVQLTVGDDGLSLTATDLDLAIVEAAPCDVTQPGGTTAPAHTMYDIVRKLSDGAQVEFTLSPDDSRLMLRAGRSEFALSCLPSEDFPVMSEDDLPHRFTVKGAEFARLIEKTRFAISTEETRYYLNGIYVHAAAGDGGGSLRAVATDGHRLAQAEIALPAGADGMPGVIIPRKAVTEIFKLIDETDSDVEIALSDTRIRFAVAGTVLTSKLIDGTFPDYERVIPSGNDKVMEVDREIFARAVDRVSTISSEKSRAVKMMLAGEQITLSANSPDQGSASEELSASYDGENLEIGFNSKYLLDITGQVDGDTAQFIMSDASSPTIIRDVGDDGALYVLMPMRV